MRELLEKWAKLEPGRFDAEAIEWVKSANPTNSLVLMQTQWAIQAAIVERGWPLELEWDGEWIVWINYQWTHSSLDNPAEALLAAYLAAIEA